MPAVYMEIQASACSVIMVEEVNPGEEIFCGAELLHEGSRNVSMKVRHPGP